MNHPSFLELDRLALDPTGETAPAATSAHSTECERCRSYVQELRVFEREARLPEWALARTARSSSRSVAARVPWRAFFGLSRERAPWVIAALVTLAFGILLLPLTREQPAPTARAPYLAAKGGPSVGVFVKRADRVFAWDGVESVSVGDRLRLSIVRGGYADLVVLTRAPHGLVTLYRARLPKDTELPVAWEVNREGSEERLIVVLSNRELSDQELSERLTGSREFEPDTWMQEYVLPKRAGIDP